MTLIEEMEMYAHEHDVPIMQKEGIDFMCSFLKEHNLKHVLEIGSAIAIRQSVWQCWIWIYRSPRLNGIRIAMIRLWSM